MDTTTIMMIVSGCAASVLVILCAFVGYFWLTRDPEDDDSALANQKVAELGDQCADPKLYVRRENKDGKWSCPSTFPHDTGINWTSGEGFYTSGNDTYNGKQCTSNQKCVEYVLSLVKGTAEKAPAPAGPAAKSTDEFATEFFKCRGKYDSAECQGIQHLRKPCEHLWALHGSGAGFTGSISIGYQDILACVNNYYGSKTLPDAPTQGDVGYWDQRYGYCLLDDFRQDECKTPGISTIKDKCFKDRHQEWFHRPTCVRRTLFEHAGMKVL